MTIAPGSRARSASEETGERPASVAIAALAIAGGIAALLLAAPAPAAPGAARLTSADVVLGAFDVLWLLALAWPRGRSARGRVLVVVTLLAVGLPFHVAFAAAAGAGAGHAAAFGGIALAACVAGASAPGGATYPSALVAACVALPLAGYAFSDLAGVDALAFVRASPLTSSVLLARRAPDVGAADGVPAATVLLIVALIGALRRRPFGAGARALAVLAVCAAAVSATAETPRVEPLLGGVVREGAPVVVRAPGAQRVRARGGPWAGPVGERRDEFVLLWARPRGDVLDVDVTDVAGNVAAVELAVRPLPARQGPGGGGWTASLAPRAGDGLRDGVVSVRPIALPTVPEAWLVFDDVGDVPDGLPPAARRALDAACSRPRSRPFEPALLPPSPQAFRAAAQSAAVAPRLSADVGRVLGIVAVLVIVLVVIVRRRPASGRLAAAWLAAPPVVALVWMLLSGALPGAVRGHAIVLERDGAAVALLRLSAVRSGEVTVALTDGAGGVASLLVPVRWGPGDSAPEGVAVGTTARLRIERGHSVLLAFRLPAGDLRGGEGVGGGPALATISEWLRPAGRKIVPVAGGGALPVVLDGARLLRVQRMAVTPVR